MNKQRHFKNSLVKSNPNDFSEFLLQGWLAGGVGIVDVVEQVRGVVAQLLRFAVLLDWVLPNKVEVRAELNEQGDVLQVPRVREVVFAALRVDLGEFEHHQKHLGGCALKQVLLCLLLSGVNKHNDVERAQEETNEDTELECDDDGHVVVLEVDVGRGLEGEHAVHLTEVVFVYFDLVVLRQLGVGQHVVSQVAGSEVNHVVPDRVLLLGDQNFIEDVVLRVGLLLVNLIQRECLDVFCEVKVFVFETHCFFTVGVQVDVTDFPADCVLRKDLVVGGSIHVNKEFSEGGKLEIASQNERHDRHEDALVVVGLLVGKNMLDEQLSRGDLGYFMSEAHDQWVLHLHIIRHIEQRNHQIVLFYYFLALLVFNPSQED